VPVEQRALRDNARCPLQVYAGVGVGVFFAETSNQFGRATDNPRAGLNALAETKYFFNEHIALFAEYKLTMWTCDSIKIRS
jgi:hypothetical protein